MSFVRILGESFLPLTLTCFTHNSAEFKKGDVYIRDLRHTEYGFFLPASNRFSLTISHSFAVDMSPPLPRSPGTTKTLPSSSPLPRTAPFVFGRSPTSASPSRSSSSSRRSEEEGPKSRHALGAWMESGLQRVRFPLLRLILEIWQAKLTFVSFSLRGRRDSRLVGKRHLCSSQCCTSAPRKSSTAHTRPHADIFFHSYSPPRRPTRKGRSQARSSSPQMAVNSPVEVVMVRSSVCHSFAFTSRALVDLSPCSLGHQNS